MAKKIVKLDFVAKELNSGKVFDTTKKEIAESTGLFDEKRKYGPMTAILGQGEIHKALEEAVQEMKEGEEKKIVLDPEKAFGERKAENIVVMPLKNFQENKMMPFPGLVFEANGMQGKVQSVSGGRVRVDFNHPLAGKTVEYEIKLIKNLVDKNEAAKELLEKFLPIKEEKKFEIKGNELNFWVPKELDMKNAEPFKKVLEKIFIENIEGITKVNFIEAPKESTTTTQTEKKVEATEPIATKNKKPETKEPAKAEKKSKPKQNK